jgi:3-hydroxyacyl-[acyl-carrier-protein] dehydratase
MSETTYDIKQILNILPHRYPLLLVDRILEMVPGDHVTGLKNVTINEPFFQGHFPDRPVMPGVLIVEAMAQVGGVMAYFTMPEHRDKLIYFMSIDKVKFRKPVLPGDQLIIEVLDKHRSTRAWKMTGKAYVDGKVAAQAELTAAIGIDY